MAKHKLLSGRVKVTPAANVTADRYEFLGLEQAEPSLGTASANGFVLTYNTNVTGNRLWAPGGLESNLAYAHANAAFNAANNAVDTWVRDAANSASSYANGAFAKANTANTLAQAAYDAANNAVDTWVRDAANSASSYANGAFVAANTADQRAVTSGDYANSSFLVANSASSYANGAFVAANTADQRAVTSGSYANSAFLVANSASSYANGAFVAANTADQRAVTSGDYANSSFLVANSASSYANGAFGSANSAGLYANAAFAAANLKYNSSGGTISGDVTITGNLTVEGNTLIVNVSTLSVEDSLIQLARNNITDAVDIGFLGHYNTGSGNVHAGLIRRASDDSFYLFDNLTTEPLTNVIDIANSSIATLRANLISSDVSIRGYDPINHTNNAYQVANSGSSYANSSYLHANAAFNAANNATDTWVRNAANSASSYANSGYIHANSAFDKANAGYNLINGAFGVSVTLDTFTGDSSCTTFSLNTTPSNENYTLIIIDGVTQLKSAYSLSGANVVFSEAPATNTSIEIVTFTSSAIQKVGVSITVDTFTGDSSCTAFTLSTTPKDENYITVTIDGLTQQKSAYSLSGTILTFTEAPSTNTSIEVTTFQSADEYAANTLSQTAFDKANSANVLAQAAFNAANNASDTWVRNAANAASSYANSAFGVANSASSYANGAFGVANTADQRAVTSGVYANSAYIHANAAFNAANNAVDTWVRDAANSASSYANGAFAKANSANVLAQTAFDAANNATDTWVRQAANSASSYANGAFAAANTADQKAVSAGSYANSSYLHANAAFNAANNATDTWVRNAANSASSYANSGYIHANSAFDKANAGYNLINSSFGVSVTVDNFTGDASCTTFSLSTTPVNENYTLITLNGITQHKSAYSLSGANVVFSEAPNTNVAIDVVTFTSSAIQKVGVSITLDTFTGDNSCTSFTLSSTPKDENYTMVSIDGVNQNKSAYSLSGAILTFSEAPGTSAAIEVTTFQSADEYASNTLSQLAFNKANSANILAQAAFDTANNATDTWVRNAANAASSYANSAFGVANSASSYANGAFAAANTADQRAVTSGSYANSAYALANVKYDATGGTISGDVIVSGNLTVSGQTTYANSTVVNLGDAIITLNADIPQAFAPSENAGIEVDRGSSANVQLIWNETTDKWTFTNDGSSYSDIGSSAAESYANSAFAASNTADQRAVTSGTYANTAFGVANSASSYANGAFVAANTADQRAVTSGSYANSAYTQANTGVTNATAASSYANSAFGVANSASSYANGAFVAANTADQRAVTSGTYSNSAFGVANSASSYANGAFAAANTADQRAVTSGDYANSAFSKANTANTLAQAAFDAANTGSSDSWARSSANAASSYANSAYLHANAAFNQANTGGGSGTDAYARAHANAAFEVANTATSGGERIYVASIDTFTSNGQNTVFTLSVTPPSTNSVMVYIDGVYQQTSAYTLSGTTLTMSEAVDANSTVQVRTFANTAVTDIGVTVNEFTGTGACTTFTLTTVPVSKNLTSIIVGGVPQMKSAYSISGSNVVFTAAPANNASIEVSTYKGGGSYATSFRSVVDTFTGDNSTTEFTLSTVPSTEKETFVYLNGVYQNKSTYSISGANVILTGTATSNDTIEVVTVAGSEMNVSSSRYNSRVYTANGSQTAFTISSGHSANSVLVFENGICQEPITDYTVSGTTLTFTTAPAANVKIQIRELPV